MFDFVIESKKSKGNAMRTADERSMSDLSEKISVYIVHYKPL